ncbi:hypothetical protein PRZ48_004910 [Zasmidium cellare]|uniref:Amino acid transporter transmembrane domain-containing protein n=1 Tax=Zasmidium cellare TaxID=395010 RepID=A0ABR0ERW0_ZASCE|nr:hypothetical protein PRZ48_004910 [Zasmidium cellare]
MATHEKYHIEAAHGIPEDGSDDREVFGNEKRHEIQYRTLSWPFVAFIMTTEIVTIGTLGFPQAFAVVGMVPGIIVSVFCGVFALYTALLLIDFKLNHPEVHNMGDAGYILFAPFGLGWLGREVLSGGTIIFAIFTVGAMQLTGGLALAALSDHKLCAMVYNAIFAAPILIVSLPRTLDYGLQHLSLIACVSVLISGLIGMIGAGIDPVPGRHIDAAIPQSFSTAFLTITNPVIAYAGHFMFFPLMSEMKQPRDAKKSAWALQIFATTFFVLFGVVTYVYLGSTVTNPSYLSLPSTVWAKAAWGLLLPNILARPLGFTLAVLTLLAGAFICVAGLYAIIDALVQMYASGEVGHPFSC